MANLTAKLNLVLPAHADYYNVVDFNSNFTAIDNFATEQANANTSTDNRIKGQTFKEATVIAEGIDLNTLKTAGVYVCSTDATASTLINYPAAASKKAFAMVVIQIGNTSVQTLYISDNTIYSRQIYASSVSNWVKIGDSVDLAAKVDKVDGKQLSTQDYTTAEKNKLAGIEANANKYVHPVSHPANMIIEDSTHRFMTDAERVKLGSVSANANNYTHPSAHDASIITTDATRRFVSDAEKALWNSKASGSHNHDSTYATLGNITDVKKQTHNVLNKTLYTTDWTLVSGLYRATITDAKVAVDSIVSANVQLAYLDTAMNAGMKPVTVSFSGGFYMYCAIKPSASIVLDYSCVKEVA